MINDDKFKARLREAVLDFLQQKGRVPTQKELRALYGIKLHSLDYFRTSRGYKTMYELFEECVGFEIPSMNDVPFDEKLREVLLKHMRKFGCLPFLTEIKIALPSLRRLPSHKSPEKRSEHTKLFVEPGQGRY